MSVPQNFRLNNLANTLYLMFETETYQKVMFLVSVFKMNNEIIKWFILYFWFWSYIKWRNDTLTVNKHIFNTWMKMLCIQWLKSKTPWTPPNLESAHWRCFNRSLQQLKIKVLLLMSNVGKIIAVIKMQVNEQKVWLKNIPNQTIWYVLKKKECTGKVRNTR